MDAYEMCRDGDVSGLEYLIQKAVSKQLDVVKGLNKRNYFGRTPMHVACRFGQLECVKLLLKYDIDLEIINSNGYTILHDAACYRQVKILKFLVEEIEDPKRKETIKTLLRTQNNFGSLPLHVAIKSGSLECVQILYPKSPLNLLNDKKHTALHTAIAVGKPEIAKFIILSSGCDPLRRDRNLADCIHYVTMNESGTREFNADLRGILHLILQGITPNKKRLIVGKNFDKYKNSPLHYAAFNGLHDILEDLLSFYHEFEQEENESPLLERNVDGFSVMDLSSVETVQVVKRWYHKRKNTVQSPLLLLQQ